MVIVDCHAHLSDDVFKDVLSDMILDLQRENIFVISVGMNYVDFEKVVNIAAQNKDCIGFGLGLHPIQCGEIDKRPLSLTDTNKLPGLFEELASSAICLGECGLDFSKWLCPTSIERDMQRSALKVQIELSKKHNLPLNLHSRSAGKPLLDILRQNNVKGALLHAFDGGKKAIKQGVEDGHYFSIAPSIVRDPSQKQVATNVPLDRLVLESDSPALGPVKGQTNTPLNLLKTVDCLADLLNCSKDHVVEVTTQNAVRLFPKLRNHIKL